MPYSNEMSDRHCNCRPLSIHTAEPIIGEWSPTLFSNKLLISTDFVVLSDFIKTDRSEKPENDWAETNVENSNENKQNAEFFMVNG
jgi:hypothetical protein